ncbi:MAG: MerR family transcriptional regulator, partial [Lachnospiraceae bacterium]|nr:MerR family transcriptional regulator [Lachnospiraceae bacterium]
MNIQELEKRTGITKQNIRFYERKGLLCPKRNTANNYREYTEEDE